MEWMGKYYISEGRDNENEVLIDRGKDFLARAFAVAQKQVEGYEQYYDEPIGKEVAV